MADLAGINLALQTPFNADGSINLAEWERLIDVYINAAIGTDIVGYNTPQATGL